MKKVLIVALSVSIVLIGFSVLSVAEETKRVGNCLVNVKEDPLTDKLSIVIGVPSNQTKEEGTTSFTMVAIRLQEGTTDLIVMWQYETLANSKIVYRLDEGEVEETEWNMAGNQSGLFFPDETEDLESFVERLIKAEEFIVGVYPQGKTRSTDVFELEGLGEALLPYLEKFGWEDLEDTIEKEMEKAEEY